MISSAFWRDRSVFVAGHTGFRGAWLSLALERLSARVTGYALNPTTPSLYATADVGAALCDVRGDMNDSAMLDGALRAADPEIVFHLAPLSLRRAVAEAAVGAPALQATVIAAPDRRRRPRGEARVPRSQGQAFWVYCPDAVGGDIAGAPLEGMHVLEQVYGLLLLAETACEGARTLGRDWAFAEPADAAALGWSRLLDADETARWEMEWREAVAHGADMRAFARSQVNAYLGQRVRLVSPFAETAAGIERSAA